MISFAANPALPEDRTLAGLGSAGLSSRCAGVGATAARGQHIHLIGAAGAGMRALSVVLQGRGCVCTGSDLSGTAADDATWIRTGHRADHLPPDCDFVVYSAAVPEDNAELLHARQRGIPTLSYPEMLGRLMSERRGLAVAGTHGKSTTTAMAASILHAAGLDSTVVIGATPRGATSGGRYGDGPFLLAEACEYREHFLQLQPEIAVLLGIEWDHVDCFPALADVEAAFEGFVAQLAPGGLLLAADECSATRRIVARSGCRCETFGFSPTAHWQAVDLSQRLGHYQFTLLRGNEKVCRVALQVPGRHNVMNALAAAALGWHCRVGLATIQRGLNGFRGLQRRLEWLGEPRGVAVVDDYAHHPTEVAATLKTLREWFPDRRLWCVFQPHQAARTRALLDEFAGSLHNADRVVVADVFLAREPAAAAQTVRASDLADCLRARGAKVADVHKLSQIKELLQTALRPGDVLVTVGAGDVGKLAHGFV